MGKSQHGSVFDYIQEDPLEVSQWMPIDWRRSPRATSQNADASIHGKRPVNESFLEM